MLTFSNYGWSLSTILIGLILLTGCAKKPLPPVVEGWHLPSKSLYYIIQPNDTLYAIAWNFDLDYRTIAELNHLSAPYTIKTGQRLLLKAKPHRVPVTITKTPSPTTHKIECWHPPTTGKLLHTFQQPNLYQKGLNFIGQFNQVVYATAPGTVVYRGSALKSYGNLIIIKHNEVYLSAYGYLNTFKVKEGEQVQAKQPIGTMGNHQGSPTLHFELRKDGSPINPLPLIKVSLGK